MENQNNGVATLLKVCGGLIGIVGIIVGFSLFDKSTIGLGCGIIAVALLSCLMLWGFGEVVNLLSQIENNTAVSPASQVNTAEKEKQIILVFCKDEKIQIALDAGATYAGNTEYLDKVKGGWTDFDVVIATRDMMKDVGRLGMILGRKGLMPNPKTGTVSDDVATAVKNNLYKE